MRTITASLVFPDLTKLSNDQFRTVLRNAVLRHDSEKGTPPTSVDGGSSWIADRLTVSFIVDENGTFGPTATVYVSERQSQKSEPSALALNTLQDIVMNALARSNADFVLWMDEETILSRAEICDLPAYQRAVADFDAESIRIFPELGSAASQNKATDCFGFDSDSILDVDVKGSYKSGNSRLKAASFLVTSLATVLSPPSGALLFALGIGASIDT
jgi:hypothetical protein